MYFVGGCPLSNSLVLGSRYQSSASKFHSLLSALLSQQFVHQNNFYRPLGDVPMFNQVSSNRMKLHMAYTTALQPERTHLGSMQDVEMQLLADLYNVEDLALCGVEMNPQSKEASTMREVDSDPETSVLEEEKEEDLNVRGDVYSGASQREDKGSRQQRKGMGKGKSYGRYRRFHWGEGKSLAKALLPCESETVPALLEDRRGHLSRSAVEAAMVELGNKGRADLVVEVYRWMSRESGGSLQADAETLALGITLLDRQGCVAEAEQLFDARGLSQEAPQVYNAMLALVCRGRGGAGVGVTEGQVALAEGLMATMSQRGVQANCVTWNTLLHALCQAGRSFAELQAVLQSMRSAQVKPNACTFNTLLARLARDARVASSAAAGQRAGGRRASPASTSADSTSGSPTEATPTNQAAFTASLALSLQGQEVYKRMQEEGVVPDRVTLCTLLTLFSLCGQLELCEQVAVQAEGLQVASVPLYSALMQALCREGQPLRAVSAFHRMLQQGLQPDPPCCTLLMQAMAQAGRVEQASRTLLQWRRQGLRLGPHPYTALMQAYAREGKFQEASQTFYWMIAEGCRPDVTTYNVLMAAYGREGFTEQAEEVLQSMRKEGLHPDTVSYNTIIAALVRAGNPQRAVQLYRQMVKDGCERDVRTYRDMMRAYNMLGWHHQAIELRKKLRALQRQEKGER